MSVYKKYRELKNDNLLLSYTGEVTSEIISMILQGAERKLEETDEKSVTIKKIFNILVECLQNLYHHAEPDVENPNLRPAMVKLWMDKSEYKILTGNFIYNKNIDLIKSRIDKVNALTKDEIREYYREVLNNNQISDKGGAGLGFIDMVKKSGNKIDYSFEKITDEMSFFGMTIIVSIKKKK